MTWFRVTLGRAVTRTSNNEPTGTHTKSHSLARACVSLVVAMAITTVVHHHHHHETQTKKGTNKERNRCDFHKVKWLSSLNVEVTDRTTSSKQASNQAIKHAPQSVGNWSGPVRFGQVLLAVGIGFEEKTLTRGARCRVVVSS